MTVNYTFQTATANLHTFHRLLFRWKGSVWECIYKEFTIWAILFAIISCIYRFALSEDARRSFESVALFCDRFIEYIPLTFMLGFYVNFVIGRWWDHFLNMPWPDEVAYSCASHIRGSDDETRMLRRTVVRWVVLIQVIVFRNISSAVKKRFPTVRHLVEAGLMTEIEFEQFEKVFIPGVHKHFIVLNWVFQLLTDARTQGRISSDIVLTMFFEQINKYKGRIAVLVWFDWISIPLVYTQVAHIAVRSYFIVCLIGRQFLVHRESQEPQLDMYVPIFTILQFVFYVGWIKVAEVGINPMGEDDDDFEINWIIDRNLQVVYLIVDSESPPKPEKDKYWDEPFTMVPYTEASVGLMDGSSRVLEGAGSCAQMIVSEKEATVVPATPVLSRVGTPVVQMKTSLRRRLGKANSEVNLVGQHKGDLVRQQSDGITAYLSEKLKRSRLIRMMSTTSTCTNAEEEEANVTESQVRELEVATLDSKSTNSEYQPTLEVVIEHKAK